MCGDESHARFGRAACGNGLTATSTPRRRPTPRTARPKPGRAHALKAYGPARTPSDTRTIKRDRTNQEVSDISDESVTIAESSSL